MVILLSETSQTKAQPTKKLPSPIFNFFVFVFSKIVSHSAHIAIFMLEIKAQGAWHVFYQWLKRNHSNHHVFKVL